MPLDCITLHWADMELFKNECVHCNWFEGKWMKAIISNLLGAMHHMCCFSNRQCFQLQNASQSICLLSFTHSYTTSMTEIFLHQQFICSQRILMEICHIHVFFQNLTILLLLFSISRLLSPFAQTSPTLLQMMTTSPYQGMGFPLKQKTSYISKRSVCSQITTITLSKYNHF